MSSPVPEKVEYDGTYSKNTYVSDCTSAVPALPSENFEATLTMKQQIAMTSLTRLWKKWSFSFL